MVTPSQLDGPCQRGEGGSFYSTRTKNMSSKLQVIIGLTTLLASILALLVFLPTSGWATVAVIELAFTYAIVSSLSTNLPSGIRSGIKRNCLRANGTFSRNREHVERIAVRRLGERILVAVSLILVPTNILLWYLLTEGDPLVPNEFLSDAQNQERVSFRNFTISHFLILYFFVTLGVLGSAYWHALKELHASIQFRAYQYKIRDLGNEAPDWLISGKA